MSNAGRPPTGDPVWLISLVVTTLNIAAPRARPPRKRALVARTRKPDGGFSLAANHESPNGETSLGFAGSRRAAVLATVGDAYCTVTFNLKLEPFH